MLTELSFEISVDAHVSLIMRRIMISRRGKTMCQQMLALGSRSRMLLAGGVRTHSYLVASFVGSLLAAIGK